MSHGVSISSPAPGVTALREVWSIAWPTVLTMTSYTVMQFIDKLMVGQVGPLHVAAQGNGGIWSFFPLAVAFGVLTVVNTFVSQNLGAGKPQNGPKYAWAGLWLAVFVWAVFMVPYAAAMPWVFDLVHANQQTQFNAMALAGTEMEQATARWELARLEELKPLETGYAQILLLGSFLLLGAKAMHHYFFGLHRPKIVTLSALVGNVVNVLFNYVLIFGEKGLPSLGLPGVPGVPAMGVYGAAIGTVCGTACEIGIPLALFLGPKMNRELRSRSQWRLQLKPMKDLIRIGWPAGAQFGNELICWAIFMSVLVGTFGTNHQIAGWIALGYMHLSFMPAVGFSVATTSLVGKYIGAGKPDIAVARARLALRMAMSYMTLCGLIFFIFRYPLVDLFVARSEATPEEAAAILSIGAKLMICAAVFQTVDALGILYTGALRGAGDTVWPGYVTIIYSWLFIIGLGWLLVKVAPQIESVGPWIAASAYIIIFGVTMAVRFESGKWRRIRLLATEEERDAAQIAPIGPAAPPLEGSSSVRDIAEEIGEEVAAESKGIQA